MNPLDVDVLSKLLKDPDYILTRRFENSVEKLVERYPDGAPDRVIAQALGVEEEEVEPMYQEIINKLRGLVEPN